MPKKLITFLAGKLANVKTAWIKNYFINKFIKAYQVDMSLAVRQTAEEFENFNDFFTRELKSGIRPINPDDKILVCPADGAISQLGKITDGKIFQAKGHEYTALELLAGDEQAAHQFIQGEFATVYLSPKDYHRVHMPYAGKLIKMDYVPGPLFSVNTLTSQHVPRVFARNERVVMHFECEFGPMVLVMVGATIVGSVVTPWHGTVCPPRRKKVTTFNYSNQNIVLQKGDEAGQFKLGSTAIILLPGNSLTWQEKFREGAATLMGEDLATVK